MKHIICIQHNAKQEGAFILKTIHDFVKISPKI